VQLASGAYSWRSKTPKLARRVIKLAARMHAGTNTTRRKNRGDALSRIPLTINRLKIALGRNKPGEDGLLLIILRVAQSSELSASR
jgi:hypothetical protein